jgi:hypothetical protein
MAVCLSPRAHWYKRCVAKVCLRNPNDWISSVIQLNKIQTFRCKCPFSYIFPIKGLIFFYLFIDFTPQKFARDPSHFSIWLDFLSFSLSRVASALHPVLCDVQIYHTLSAVLMTKKKISAMFIAIFSQWRLWHAELVRMEGQRTSEQISWLFCIFLSFLQCRAVSVFRCAGISRIKHI